MAWKQQEKEITYNSQIEFAGMVALSIFASVHACGGYATSSGLALGQICPSHPWLRIQYHHRLCLTALRLISAQQSCPLS